MVLFANNAIFVFYHIEGLHLMKMYSIMGKDMEFSKKGLDKSAHWRDKLCKQASKQVSKQGIVAPIFALKLKTVG